MAELAAWLERIGLGHYAGAFAEAAIDLDVLPDLSEDDLTALGVKLGDRKRLLKAVAARQAGQEPAEAPGRPGEGTAAPAAAAAERRQLTVMFVDLVGSTELSRRLDPEDMSAVMRAYHGRTSEVIRHWGGHVAKYLGDGVLTYFGWPQAHEDDAERAVRAGLALIRAVAGIDDGVGGKLAVRVGIATGPVVVGELIGEGVAQEQAVVGETPNLAARLQTAAPPGGVIIGATTRTLLGELFELEQLDDLQLKGFGDRTAAFRVTGEGWGGSRFEVTRGRHLTPLVGRDQELALLLERWARAKAGEGQGVLLVGDAGIGKSRISRALLDAVADEPQVRVRYQCSPYHTDSALWPVIQQLSYAAGLSANAPIEAMLDKLEALLDQGGGLDAAPLIADLIGLKGAGRYGKLDLTPQVQRARTLEALMAQLLGLAARRSVLLILEDAHWIDPTTLELIEQCLGRIAHHRVLILLTSRPDHQPRLAGHQNLTRLTLNRLGRPEAGAVVANLAAEALPPEMIDAIVARSDGVPLFVEELTKAVLETSETSIPASLHDSLIARLDRLPQVKEVAQIGACIGREFELGLLACIVDRPEAAVREALEKLTTAELIFPRGTALNTRYAFKHALVRDVAYESLLRSRRQQLHARIAHVLEERFLNIADTEPEQLARHYTGAGLTDQAVAYWRRAAERSAQRSANLEAVAHLTRGLKLLREMPPDLDHQRLELEMQVALGANLVSTKGWTAPETAEAFGRARQLCELSGDTSHLIAVDWSEYVSDLLRGALGKALEKSRTMLRRSETRDDVTASLIAYRSLGIVSTHLGQMEQARAYLERALALYDRNAHAPLAHRFGYDLRVAILAYLGHVLHHLGYPAQALANSRRAVEEARRLKHASSLCYALVHLGVFHQVRDDLGDNTGVFKELIELGSEHGFSMYMWSAVLQKGFISILLGHSKEGLAEMQRGLDGWQTAGVKLTVPVHLVQLAKANMILGELETGLEHLADALTMIDETDERWYQPEVYRLRGTILLALSRLNAPEAENCFHAAIDVARSQNGKWPKLRAATSLARLWGEQGERQKAYDLLAPVYGWFTEGFDTRDLKDARALLDQLA